MCHKCSKLAFLATKRSCASCKKEVYNTISNICDDCSMRAGVCSVCKKNLFLNKKNNLLGGCKSCG